MTVLTGFELTDLDHDLLDLVRAGFRILEVQRHPIEGLRYCVPNESENWAVVTVTKVLVAPGRVKRPIEHVMVLRCPVPADASKPPQQGHRLHVTYANGQRGEAQLKDWHDEPRMFGYLGEIDDGEGTYYPKLPLSQVIAEVSADPLSHLGF